jgi:hypothetical protein
MSFGCDADYLPIVHRAGLTDATYFEWSSDDLIPEVKQEADKLAEIDDRDPAIANVMPSDKYLRKELLKGFYRDAILSQALKMPLAVDQQLCGFIAKKRTASFAQYAPSMPLAFYDRWIALDLPDFTGYSWEQIHSLHESPEGNDFRRMVERLSSQVESALPESPSQVDLNDLVDKAFSKEIIAELRARRTGLASTSASLALNLIPYGSAISAIKDVVDFGRDSTSWVSLL